MRKVLFFVALVIFSVLPLFGQQYRAQRVDRFLATGSGTGVNLLAAGVNVHQLSWTLSGGTVSACTVAVDSSADNVSWSAGGVIAGQTCTSTGSATIVSATVNYVRITVTAFTVSTGTPLLVANWTGYATNPLAGAAWSSIGAAVGNTSISQGGFTTTFPLAGNWTWKGTGGTVVPALNVQRALDTGYRTQIGGSRIDFSNVGDGSSDMYIREAGTNSMEINKSLTLLSSFAFATFEDITETAAPANPAAGKDRVYADSTSHTITCLTSGGGSCLGGGMAIGGTVTSATPGSIFFAGPVLAQDNANLGWDDTNKLFNTRRITAQANAAIIDAVTFSGVGLNNATSGGTFAGSADTAYCVKIDTIGGGGGGADTFSWGTGGSCTSGATGTDASGTQALNAGVTVTFAASTGHTLNDSWTFAAYTPISFIAKNLAGTEKTQILGASITLSGTGPNLNLQYGSASGNEGNLVFSSTIGSNHNAWSLASNDEGNDVDELTLTEKTNNTYKFYVKQGAAGSLYLNPSGGNVGIGVAISGTPFFGLEVDKSMAAIYDNTLSGAPSAINGENDCTVDTNVNCSGVEGDAIVKGAGKTFGIVAGVIGTASFTAASTVTSFTTGMEAVPATSLSGSTTAANYGIIINGDAGAVTATDNAGLRIVAQTNGKPSIETDAGPVSLGDKISKYNGVATAGVGIPAFLYSSGFAARATAVTDTTMVTPGADSMYRFSATINCTTTSAAAVANLNLKYTDTANVAQTITISDTCTSLIATGVPQEVLMIRTKSGVAVSWGVTITNTPTFDVFVRLEAM